MFAWRKQSRSNDALAELRDRLPVQIVERIYAASAWIGEQRARGGAVDSSRLDECIGVLQAARVVIAAQDRGATWTADAPRLECVFDLEARYEEGVLIRDRAPSAPWRDEMDAKLLALRDILNAVKAGAPIRESEGLPSL